MKTKAEIEYIWGLTLELATMQNRPLTEYEHGMIGTFAWILEGKTKFLN